MTIMNNQNQTDSTPVWILVPMLLLVVVVIPFLPLFISRRWDWVEAWIYAIVFILGFIISRHNDILTC